MTARAFLEQMNGIRGKAMATVSPTPSGVPAGTETETWSPPMANQRDLHVAEVLDDIDAAASALESPSRAIRTSLERKPTWDPRAGSSSRSRTAYGRQARPPAFRRRNEIDLAVVRRGFTEMKLIGGSPTKEATKALAGR